MNKELGYLVVAAGASALAVAPLDLHDFALDPRLLPWAAGFGVVWTSFRLGKFLRAWKRHCRWRRSSNWSVDAADLPFESVPYRLPRKLRRCLPRRLRDWLYRDTGILLGRAFRWSPQHTQELESYVRDNAAPLPTGADGRGGYPALHAVGIKQERPLVLPWSELVGHVLIGGTTRSGKTRLLEVILCEAIRGPGSVVVIDPKGDAEFLMRAASQARALGRDFAFFSPAFPEQSATFNPFGTCENTTELAARVQALMPGGGAMAKDPFFTEYPLAIIERLGAAQHAIGETWTIERLNAVATLLPPFQDLIARYLDEVVFEGEAVATDLDGLIEEYGRLEGGRRDLLADALLDDYSKPRDHFQKVTANLTPAFRGVTGGRMAGLLSSDKPKLTWKGIVRNETVVYFAMNSLMFGEVANRIGRVILQDLIGFLGRRYAYEDPNEMSPITILLDEFSNIAYPGFIDALNKGGGARAHFMLAMQSLADPEAAMGRDGTQRVLDNLNTRVWFRLSDDRTAKLATEGLGFANVSHAQVGYSLGFGGSGPHSASVGGGLQHVEKPLIRSEWLTAMPRGEALVRLKGENWKLRVPLLAPVPEDELREVAGHYGLAGVLTDVPKDRTPGDGDASEREGRAQTAEVPGAANVQPVSIPGGEADEAPQVEEAIGAALLVSMHDHGEGAEGDGK
ncbi:MAG: type IV secretory system conjugative DNA transfer family protein [Candidatus Tectomicrobia bacterium]|nr:type IV secretory system conjugative DNA transfer family protein [Candidatus Tectomicrobia bacterium]